MANKAIYLAVFSGRAQKELITSMDWYEEKRPGLGDEFIAEVLDKVQQIEANPELFAAKYRQYRETKIETFPFLIIYRISRRAKSIRVVSVFHTARNHKTKYI